MNEQPSQGDFLYIADMPSLDEITEQTGLEGILANNLLSFMLQNEVTDPLEAMRMITDEDSSDNYWD